MSDSVWPQRWQPTRLPCLWDSPGKNTGVDCHFLLQCMNVKSENEVAQSCPTLSAPMDCSPPGSSVHGIFQARVLEWGACIAMSNTTKANIPSDFMLSWVTWKLMQCLLSSWQKGIYSSSTHSMNKHTWALTWASYNSGFSRFYIQRFISQILILVLLLTSWKILDKLLSSSDTQFNSLWSGDDNSSHIKR